MKKIFLSFIASILVFFATAATTILTVFSVEKSGSILFGVKDSNGKIIIPAKYRVVEIWGNYVYALDALSAYYFNDKGTQLAKFCDIQPFKFGVSIVTDCSGSAIGTRGLMNRQGKMIVPTKKYTRIEPFEASHMTITEIISKEKSLYGAIDTLGQVIAPAIYDEIKLNQLTAWFKRNGKWGVVSYGDESVPPVFEGDAPQFDNRGLANMRYGNGQHRVTVNLLGEIYAINGREFREPKEKIQNRQYKFRVYNGWLKTLPKVEETSNAVQFTANNIKASQVFAEGPDGWLRDQGVGYSFFLQMEANRKATVAKVKQDFISLAAQRSGQPISAIRLFEEKASNLVQKGTFLFYVANDSKGMVGGNYFDCLIVFPGKQTGEVSVYQISMEGVPDLKAQETYLWAQYFKRVLERIYPL